LDESSLLAPGQPQRGCATRRPWRQAPSSHRSCTPRFRSVRDPASFPSPSAQCPADNQGGSGHRARGSRSKPPRAPSSARRSHHPVARAPARSLRSDPGPRRHTRGCSGECTQKWTCVGHPRRFRAKKRLEGRFHAPQRHCVPPAASAARRAPEPQKHPGLLGPDPRLHAVPPRDTRSQPGRDGSAPHHGPRGCAHRRERNPARKDRTYS
jgi:hypothetical protein